MLSFPSPCELCGNPAQNYAILTPKHGPNPDEVTIAAFYAASCVGCAMLPIHAWHYVVYKKQRAEIEAEDDYPGPENELKG